MLRRLAEGVAETRVSYKESIESISAPGFTDALMSPQLLPVAYTLQIISANDLPLRRFKIFGEPRRNVFVKAKVEDCSEETKVRMRSSSPEWKETFKIEARDASSKISLQLFDSALRSKPLICASEIKISELLQLCRYGKAAKLNLQDGQSRPKGHIKIHLSLSRSGSWSADEAEHLSSVLARQPKIATGGYIDAVDGLLGIDFPTPPAMAAQSIQNVIDKLENFMRIADAVSEVHPYAKGAVVVLTAVYKIIVAQMAIDQSVADLFQTMQDVYSFVDAIEAVPTKIKLLEKIIERILIQTAECGRLIQEYSGHGFAGRCLRENMGASTPDKVAAMAQNLTTLRGQFDTGVAIHTAVVCFRIQTDVTTLLKNQTLDKLGSSGVSLAHRVPDQCIPGTRRDVIDEILGWASRPSKGDNSNVFFLHGVAGIGKSAVAAAVATRFAKMDRLGAFVSFERPPPGQSQPSTAVKALALQMAVRDKRLRASIIEVINDDDTKDPVLDALLPEQFDRLIVKPLASIPTLAGEGPIVIVLDGLYECGQPDDWASLLELLIDKTDSLPSNLRFIITSRTVDGILDAVTVTVLHPRIKCRELRSSSHSDISAYFTFRMEKIRRKNTYLQEDWPGQAAIVKLTARAFGFLPWAVNTSKFVDEFDPPERLKSLLLQPLRSISKPNPSLDELYAAALNSVGDWKNPSFVKHFRAIMGAIIESPIAISAAGINRVLDGLLSPISPPAIVTIRRLGSVLSYGPVVQVLHPSFLDFLTSRERCGYDDWYFEDGPVRGSVEPATLCLQRMNAGLKCNIRNMTFLARDHPITKTLPEELERACQFWVDHICTSGRFESWEMEALVVFLRTHILHWFEAMGLMKKSEEIVPMLQRVATWLEENTFEDENVQNLVIEAIDVARKFAADITQHPLCVYYVVLHFCTSDSILYQLFHNDLVDLPVLLVPLHELVRTSAEPATLCLRIMNAGSKRNICSMMLPAHLTTEVLPADLAYAYQSWVDHICPNGTFEPTKMETLAIFLRTHLLHWFEAMSILKKSGEIAPMLQRVAIWLEANTFEDKSLKDLVIEAIDFARKFAAEIAEHPLYVYYTALPLLPSHSMLYHLFHDSLVDPSVLLVTSPDFLRCLALSTNGRQIVAGSYDHAIVRDTATGKELVKMADTDGNAHPLSVAFSYDGSRVTCGTHISTVYVWDSMTGARVIGPLSHSGSSAWVNVVAWSTDGECLLSGCRTGEVILWNITSPNGNQPITKIHHPGCSEHENPLISLVFSSDGSQIASCSRRGDVHVWNSKTGGIVWSVQEPQGSDPSGGISFLSSDMREFLVVKTKERTQVRDTSTGELCPLPDSLAGAVGLTRGDFMVNLLMKGIKNHHGIPDESLWATQGEYFAFAKAWNQFCVVHLPKLLL
ncbi:WD40 repeat-like protein [Athelia psychrophila]|uniref:WD40 repeat-like protein n=1 Tax=Athelia psychrophila TaxID=1759441 RepID=A0A166QJF9_9AGAM|nr:WD40 repeat-like protein [Fibularhizoctonia sp. CBS 109695]